MKLIKPEYIILTDLNSDVILKAIESAGRICYKSEDKITEESAVNFVKMLIERGHESVLEHQSFSVKFICDRGVSHELVRHRLSSFSQESTRYCNYSNNKFDNQITFIIPNWIKDINGKNDEVQCWKDVMRFSEVSYNRLIELGWKPQQARSVLPNSLKTEIVVTANIRQWREMFRQRTAKVAHPQMRELMCPLLDEVQSKIPIVFNDINY